MPEPRGPPDGVQDAAAVASMLIDRADRDLVFIVRLVGESQDILYRHFKAFVEAELARRGYGYGDHPLLRLFVETHARVLANFVTNGVGLNHQLGVQAFERLAGDPMRLLRADVWDSVRSHIEAAQQHFVSDIGGLQEILREMTARPPLAPGATP